MNHGQEIDPLLLQNAHLLGQQRTPTKAEIRRMEKEAITMTVLQVASTALSSMLESGDPIGRSENLEGIALHVAKDLLEVSQERQNDFGENFSKRKLRNQLAAQLIYSSLRGGIVYKKNLIHRAFNSATKLIEEAESYAETQVTDDTSSIIT